MAAGDTRAADPVDTVYHEINSAVRSHGFLNLCNHSNRKSTCPREGASWTIHMINLQYAVIKDSQIVSEIRSRGIILYKGTLLSAVRRLSYYWKKEERKRLSRPI